MMSMMLKYCDKYSVGNARTCFDRSNARKFSRMIFSLFIFMRSSEHEKISSSNRKEWKGKREILRAEIDDEKKINNSLKSSPIEKKILNQFFLNKNFLLFSFSLKLTFMRWKRDDYETCSINKGLVSRICFFLYVYVCACVLVWSFYSNWNELFWLKAYFSCKKYFAKNNGFLKF